MTAAPCPACGCREQAAAHALVAALQDDDVDGAIDRGLLETTGCESCHASCTAMLVDARDRRRFALDARERYRARERRLAARAAQRLAARPPKPGASATTLPAGASAALQRALAKASVRP